MVAGLLYIAGLVASLATVAIIGLNAMPLVESATTALNAPGADIIGIILTHLRYLEWAVTPFVGGLVLMALGRIVMLLGSIDRALRGAA